MTIRCYSIRQGNALDSWILL